MDSHFDDQALQAFLDHLSRNPENLDIDIESLQQEAVLQQQHNPQVVQQQLLQSASINGHSVNGHGINGHSVNGHGPVNGHQLNGGHSVNGGHNQTQIPNGLVVISSNGGTGHQLPDSPPDSGSEPPFSPEVHKAGSPPATGTSPSVNGSSPGQHSSNTSPSSHPEVTSTTNPNSATMHVPSIVPPSSNNPGGHPGHGHHGHDGNNYPVPPPYPRQLIPSGPISGHPGMGLSTQLGPLGHPHHGPSPHPLLHHHPGHHHHHPLHPGHPSGVPGTAINVGQLGHGQPIVGHSFGGPEATYMYRSNDVEIEVPISGQPGQGQGPGQKKRKYNGNGGQSDGGQSPKLVPSSLGSSSVINIKQEPMSNLDGAISGGNRRCNGRSSGVTASPEPPCIQSMRPSCEDDFGFDYPNTANDGTGSVYLGSEYQCIKFEEFLEQSWHTLYDEHLKEIPRPNFRVDADKGFNFSNADDAFVCQKKNHFQVTVHVQPLGIARYIKSLTDGTPKEINKFYLHFYGCKTESPTQTIKVEQSQSDRSKKSFHPQEVELVPGQVSKTTVGRLHFSETTSNNMRKKGKPNPDQRYFRLVVTLAGHCSDGNVYHIVSHGSERIIVRASNPGQFENDMELSWQKGSSPESIFHAGRVGINTDRPDESLVVHGNVKVTGHIIQPSDARAKKDIKELDTKEQLKNVSNMRIVKYNFRPEFAKDVGLSGTDMLGTGVLAQEVAAILPDAVKPAGDMILTSGETIENFLVVNNDRIFMENVGAVKELCKVTDNLETRIDELERMNNKLRKINRFDSIKSVMSHSSVTSSSTVTCHSSYSGNNSRKTGNQVRGGGQCHSRHKLTDHPRCHPRSSCNHTGSVSSEICSNRFMQSIIMILVLIMAFCLAMIATLYILEYHKKNNVVGHHGLAHVVGVPNPPTGQQYLVVTHGNSVGGTPTIHIPSGGHSSNPTIPTIHIPSGGHSNNPTIPTIHIPSGGHSSNPTIPGYGHTTGLDSPSVENSLLVPNQEKSSGGSRDKNQSPVVVNKPVTMVTPSVVTTTRTNRPSVMSTSGSSTTRFVPSLLPTVGVNPFNVNDLTEGGKSSSLDRDRQKDRTSNFGHDDRSTNPVAQQPGHVNVDPGHTNVGHTGTNVGLSGTNVGLSGSSGHASSEDEDQHQVLPSVPGLGSKSVSNPVSNGVSNNAHSSDLEVNI